MLDMGFLPDIRRVLKLLPAKRQTLFFSATLPDAIQKLAGEMLRNPVRINLERKSAPAVGITQAVYPVPQALKSKLLVALLDRDDVRSVLVFTRTKHRANRLARFLEKFGLRAGLLHGNRSQSQRTKALDAFKNGKQRVLVATDIAARGIDVEELSHVINFDVPAQAEDYIHRVGRTGRADATGDAFTFVSPEEESDLRTIERALGKRLPRITMPDFDYKARPPAEERRPHRPAKHSPKRRMSAPPFRRPAAPLPKRAERAEHVEFGRGVHGADGRSRPRHGKPRDPRRR
jgi:ATP-dependent RNA helicase RhlE